MRSLSWRTSRPQQLGRWVLAVGVLTCAVAGAEEVALDPPPTAEAVQAARPAQTTVTTTTTTTAAPIAPVAPVAPVAPITPGAPAAPVMPVAPVPAQGPMYFNGPVYVVPAPVTGQPVQALPPPPVYHQPQAPQRYRTASCCALPPPSRYHHAMVRRPQPRGPVFSMGLRFTAMGINQEVLGQSMNMLGGGLQLRFRNQGHWGFETGLDILRANIQNPNSLGFDQFTRTSYPWTAAVMLYVFKNRPENHFNIFGVAGIGLMADDVRVSSSRSGFEGHQKFLELMGQAGGGVELRFRRLALSADIRAIALAADDSSPAGSYYPEDLANSGPVPRSSVGYKANLAAMLTF